MNPGQLNRPPLLLADLPDETPMRCSTHYLDCRVRDAARLGGDHDGRALSENPTNSGLA